MILCNTGAPSPPVATRDNWRFSCGQTLRLGRIIVLLVPPLSPLDLQDWSRQPQNWGRRQRLRNIPPNLLREARRFSLSTHISSVLALSCVISGFPLSLCHESSPATKLACNWGFWGCFLPNGTPTWASYLFDQNQPKERFVWVVDIIWQFFMI